MEIRIEKEAKDRLSKTVYVFDFTAEFSRTNFVLSSYFEAERATTRHKYVKDRLWQRILQRSNSFDDTEMMVLLTQDIVQEAKEIAKQRIDEIMVRLSY